jgi:hypothetical protein
MNTLELSTNELLTLKDIVEGDMEITSWGEVDYADVEVMQFYLDRAKVLEKLKEILKS